MDAASGGGRYKESPDGKYVANASSLENWIFAEYREPYGQLSIASSKQKSEPFIEILIRPENVQNSMEYRLIDDLITWSGDSLNVIFRTPTGEFKIRIPK